MDKMLLVAKKIDTFLEWTGQIVKWLALPIMSIILLETISRKVFNHPYIWTFELTYFFYGYHFMLGAAATLMWKRHVSIDIIFERLPPKWKHILSIFSHVVLTGTFCAGILYAYIPVAINSWKIMEEGQSVWRPNIAHYRTLLPVAFILLLVASVSQVLQHIVALKKGEEE
jgi:TRAP-type mannitol/chloroaromatic compound transport system permease small subunit